MTRVENVLRLKSLKKDRFEGVMVGRALYSGAFTLREALEVVATQV